MIETLDYDSRAFPFDALLREILQIDDLAHIETHAEPKPGWSIYKTMEHDPLYARLEAALLGPRGEAFREVYHAFIAAHVHPLFDAPIYYQACPTVRLMFANARGAPRFHRDADYGHERAEVNFWLPVTSAFGTNTIWIESAPGRGDHRAIALEPGKFVRFDGASLSHGAVANNTGRSRVSLDFRAIEQGLSGPRPIAGSDVPERLDAHLFRRCD